MPGQSGASEAGSSSSLASTGSLPAPKCRSFGWPTALVLASPSPLAPTSEWPLQGATSPWRLAPRRLRSLSSRSLTLKPSSCLVMPSLRPSSSRRSRLQQQRQSLCQKWLRTRTLRPCCSLSPTRTTASRYTILILLPVQDAVAVCPSCSVGSALGSTTGRAALQCGPGRVAAVCPLRWISERGVCRGSAGMLSEPWPACMGQACLHAGLPLYVIGGGSVCVPPSLDMLRWLWASTGPDKPRVLGCLPLSEF